MKTTSRRRQRTRPGNAYDRGVRAQTTISPKASKAIDELLATGLFGPTRASVVQELVYRSLRDPAVAHFSKMGRAMMRMPPLVPRHFFRAEVNPAVIEEWREDEENRRRGPRRL